MPYINRTGDFQEVRESVTTFFGDFSERNDLFRIYYMA
jgi:hypothetical protein